MPDFAVSVAVWGDETPVVVASNTAWEVPADTMTVAGTLTAALLLERLTTIPPAGAGAVRDTAQGSVMGWVTVPTLQARSSSAAGATPVPLKLITSFGFVGELLAMVNRPVAAPIVFGSNCTLIVAV